MTAIMFTPSGFGYTVKFAYNRDAVELLKIAVPSWARSWHPDRRVWEIEASFGPSLAAAMQRLGHTVVGIEPEPQPRATNTDTDSAQWAQALFSRVGPGRTAAVYRSLSRCLHPDTPTGDKQLQQELNDAHATLSRSNERK